MLRSFIPFVLASLGFAMILWADRSPLYEWQVSEIVRDVSSTCDFKIPTYLTARLGESFDAGKADNLKIVVRRSWSDKVLDRASLALDKTIPWFSAGVLISVGYMWWFLLRDKQNRVSHSVTAVFLTGVAVFMCLLLSQVVRLAGPAIGWQLYYFAKDCQGTIAFSTELLRIYYVTPIIIFMGILIELAAVGRVWHQIKMTLAKENESL